MTDQYKLQSQLYFSDSPVDAVGKVAPYLHDIGMRGPRDVTGGQLFENDGLVGRVRVFAHEDLRGTRFEIHAPDGDCLPVGRVMEPLKGLGGYEVHFPRR